MKIASLNTQNSRSKTHLPPKFSDSHFDPVIYKLQISFNSVNENWLRSERQFIYLKLWECAFNYESIFFLSYTKPLSTELDERSSVECWARKCENFQEEHHVLEKCFISIFFSGNLAEQKNLEA